MSRIALIVLSGGQDSTTALMWAKQRYEVLHAITFNYGQRHAIELEAAKKVAALAHCASHEIIEVGPILKGSSPLTDLTKEVGHYDSVDKLPGGIEPTFVPGRNILFLALAANRAAVLGVHSIVMGLCQADFGGYPDCRQKFVEKMQAAINEGLHDSETPNRIIIETPLMHLTKGASVLLAKEIPGAMEALAHSHTSYDGDYPPNPFNHASLLRARGFKEAGLPDPLIVRAKQEKQLPHDYPEHGLVEGTRYNDPDKWHDLIDAEDPAPAPVAEKEAVKTTEVLPDDEAAG